MKSGHSKSHIQGEGDYDSAKQYNEHARAFVQAGKVEQAAKAAAPHNAREQEDMLKAEAEGRSHAKGRSHAAADQGTPGRQKPAKQAPGKHPQGRNPDPEKLPGR